MKYSTLIVLAFSFFSCERNPVPECLYCDDPNHYELILSAPEMAFVGDPVSILIVFYGNKKPTLLKWYTDDFPYPQSLRKVDRLASASDAGFRFIIPPLTRGGSKYYVRFVIGTENGLTLLEKTISINVK